VARDLLASERLRKPVARAITTEEARAMRHQELRGLLQRLVVDCRGNIAEIARRMDRDRSTVRYHLRRMGMLDRSH
jgi:predicted transcriptional regulator